MLNQTPPATTEPPIMPLANIFGDEADQTAVQASQAVTTPMATPVGGSGSLDLAGTSVPTTPEANLPSLDELNQMFSGDGGQATTPVPTDNTAPTPSSTASVTEGLPMPGAMPAPTIEQTPATANPEISLPTEPTVATENQPTAVESLPSQIDLGLPSEGDLVADSSAPALSSLAADQQTTTDQSPVAPPAVDLDLPAPTVPVSQEAVPGENLPPQALASEGANQVNIPPLGGLSINDLANQDDSEAPAAPVMPTPAVPEAKNLNLTESLASTAVDQLSPITMIDQHLAKIEAEATELKQKIEQIQQMSEVLKKEIEQKQYSAQVLDYTLNSYVNRINEGEQQKQDLLAARSQITG